MELYRYPKGWRQDTKAETIADMLRAQEAATTAPRRAKELGLRGIVRNNMTYWFSIGDIGRW